MGRKWAICLAGIMLVIGVSVLVYPMVSNLINRQHGSYAIQELEKQVDSLNTEQMRLAMTAAKNYNQRLLSATKQEAESLEEEYEGILDFGNGIMGYIEVPKIDVKLPIYHGMDSDVLEKGIGHMPSSAFPIGGKGNHSVLTGHTGLPSARLFTDLTEMTEGDCFEVVIGGVATQYQVDRIKVVLPNETEDLMPAVGEDYCTLVTCTPYGVNSHRLLVRGSRIEPLQDSEETEPAIPVEDKTPHWQWLLLLLIIPACMPFIKRKKGKYE